MASTNSLGAEGHLHKQYSGEIASHLASVRSKLTDMERAETALLKAQDAASDDMREMLWECAIIRYARAFATGVLTSPDDEQVKLFLSADRYKTHQYILRLRNMHVAHSVNPMELAEPAIVLTDPDTTGERRLVGAASINGRTAPPKLKDISALLTLVRQMKAWFDDNHRHYSKLAHGEVSKWSIDSLYGLPDIEVKTTASPGAVAKSRPLIYRPTKKPRRRK